VVFFSSLFRSAQKKRKKVLTLLVGFDRVKTSRGSNKANPEKLEQRTMRITFKPYFSPATISHTARNAVEQCLLDAWPYGHAAEWDGKIFTTSTSRFTYSLLDADEQVWEYQGAFNGFLAQAFMPSFGSYRHWNAKRPIEILEAEGTFGHFFGSSALESYSIARETDGFGKAVLPCPNVETEAFLWEKKLFSARY
jgi:hypothetical protein